MPLYALEIAEPTGSSAVMYRATQMRCAIHPRRDLPEDGKEQRSS